MPREDTSASTSGLPVATVTELYSDSTVPAKSTRARDPSVSGAPIRATSSG